MDAVGILENAAFGTFKAAAVDQGPKILEAHGADISLLFTDVQMHGELNGFDLAHICAKNWLKIEIVVASGHLSPEPDNFEKMQFCT